MDRDKNWMDLQCSASCLRQMDERILERLTITARNAMNLPRVSRLIKRLKMQILKCDEPFIWEVLPQQLIREVIPAGIMSGWVFVLRPSCRTPMHYHPNSVQYTAVIDGSGRIRIGEEEKKIQLFDQSNSKPMWYIIEKGVSHTVTAEEAPMVVISFHTCPLDELLEVETLSGRKRIYAKMR